MEKTLHFFKQHRTAFSILFFFLFTVWMQANEAFFYADHRFHARVFGIFLFAYISICYFYRKKKDFKTEDCIFLITLGGIILRSFYILFTGLYDRQHDGGTFTTLSDELINIGHLGYIEFLAKFGHIPSFSPYEIFSYYHPPMHHILASLFIHLQLLFGVAEKLAFENVQALTGLYSFLCLPVLYNCLQKLKIKEGHISIAYAVLVFHPGMIFMSASINNDMLCTLMTIVCFYFGLCWMENKSFFNLMRIALSLGIGMISKLNCAVMAFPLAAIFLYHLIQCWKNRKTDQNKAFKKLLGQYVIFGIVTAVIGLSWVVRNLVKFGDQPGVPVATETSHLYTGNYSFWELFGFPTDFRMKEPFHNIHASLIWNTWLILFRTSIFAEVNPPELPDMIFFACQLALILAMVLGLSLFIITFLMQIREIKKGDKELGIYLLSGYSFVIITFIVFIIKYKFTCSADFRYVIIGLVLNIIGYYQFSDKKRIQSKAHSIALSILNYLLILFICLITGILLFWNQW